MNDISIGALLADHRHEFPTYRLKLTIQAFLALAAAGVITMAVSTAGSIVQMAMRLGGYQHDKQTWKRFSAEGAIVGLIVVGAGLG